MSGRGRNSAIIERARAKGLGVRDPLTAESALVPLSPQERLFALGRLDDGERNKTERRFENHLEAIKLAGEILWFSFESIKLKLAPKTFLTVDYAVLPAATMRLTMIDVKGAKAIVQEDARVKMRVAAGMFPFAFQFAYPPKGAGGWQFEDI